MLDSSALERQSRPVAEQARALPAWAIAVALALLALLPRVVGLADFFTIDEPYHWISRVRLFAEALGRRDWAATDITGHPGVTTMWLGALGRWLGRLAGVRDLGGAGAGAAYLATLRLPLAVVNSLAVPAGYVALRRLVRPSVAALAGLLWATSPFLVAHSRLLHLDALLTSFMTLSVLLLLAATTNVQTFKRSNVQTLIGSGVCAGLALLTKAPSLFLLPFVGLLLFFTTTGDRRPTTDDRARQAIVIRHSSSVFRRLRFAVPCYLLWLGAALAVVVLLWPALWVAPRAAIGDVVYEIVGNGGTPEPAGNFFLGQAVDAPGWLFYPAVLLWRTTPLTLIGLLLLPVALRRSKIEKRQSTAPRTSILDPRSSSVSSQRKGEQSVLLALLAFALLFGLMMSVEPKKFDRYLLPIWPALEILAAMGLVSLFGWITAIWSLRGYLKSGSVRGDAPLSMLGWTLLIIILTANLAYFHPYELGYYNPLLGGGSVAQRVMLVGWGEGMEQVGAWLRARPDLGRGPVLSWIPPTLAPFVPASPGVLDLRVPLLRQPSSYAVLYSRSVQRKESAIAEAYVRQTPPLFVLRRHGIEYASIHQLPRPFDVPLDAQFGDGLHLRGFSQRREGNLLTVTPSWDVQIDQAGGRFVFLHLLAPDGSRVAQIDALLDQGMFASWQAGQQFDTPFPLQLPPDLPPGQYRVVLGVYTPESGRLPLRAGPPAPAALDGPEALLLARLALP
jgi:4-amino-4-deoxy-L-arabinose transferase-like glycosyltransferase